MYRHDTRTIRVSDSSITWKRSVTRQLNDARTKNQQLESSVTTLKRDNKKLQKLVSKLEARLSVLESAQIVDDAECYK